LAPHIPQSPAASDGVGDDISARINEDMGPSVEGEAAGAGTKGENSEKPMKVKNNLRNPQGLGHEVLQPGQETSFYPSEMTERYMRVVRHAINTGAFKQVS
jgi:hypothetical protein